MDKADQPNPHPSIGQRGRISKKGNNSLSLQRKTCQVKRGPKTIRPTRLLNVKAKDISHNTERGRNSKVTFCAHLRWRNTALELKKRVAKKRRQGVLKEDRRTSNLGRLLGDLFEGV